MDSKGKKGALMFIIFAVVWEVAVGIIYGLFFSYNESAFSSMESITTAYTYASTSGTSTSFKANTTQFPFPQAVVAIAIVLLIVGTHVLRKVSQWWLDTYSDRLLPAWPSRCLSSR